MSHDVKNHLAEIKKTVKTYLLKEFLLGENPDVLEDSTPLVTGGFLDSIATLKLIAFLEDCYGIEFKAHEMSIDYINTLTDIAKIVYTKIEHK